MTDHEAQQQAELQLQQITTETLDRCLEAGAKQEDLKFIAAMVGIGWEPRSTQ